MDAHFNTGGYAIVAQDPLAVYLIYREVIKGRDFEAQPDIVLYCPRYADSITVAPPDFGDFTFLDKLLHGKRQQVTLGEGRNIILRERGQGRENHVRLYDAFLIADATRVAGSFSMNAVFPQIEAEILHNRKFVSAPILLPHHPIPSITSEMVESIHGEAERDIHEGGIPNDEKSDAYRAVEAIAREWAQWLLEVDDKKRSQYTRGDAAIILPSRNFYSPNPTLSSADKASLKWRVDAYGLERMPRYLDQLLSSPFRFRAGVHGIHGGIGPEAGLHTFWLTTLVNSESSLLLASHARAPNETDFLLTVKQHQGATKRDRYFQDIDYARRVEGNRRPPNADIFPNQIYDLLHPSRRHNAGNLSDFISSLHQVGDLPANPLLFLIYVRAEMAAALTGKPESSPPEIHSLKDYLDANAYLQNVLENGDIGTYIKNISRLSAETHEALLCLIKEASYNLLQCLMACNTAHIFDDDLKPYSCGTWTHLPREGILSIPPAPEGEKRRLLILATPASHRLPVYRGALELSRRKDLEIIPIDAPTLDTYYRIIFDLVSYQKYEEGARETLGVIAKYEGQMRPGDVIILGCTEFSVPQVAGEIHRHYGDRFQIVDNDIIAVRTAGQQLAEAVERLRPLQTAALASMQPELPQKVRQC